MAPSAATPHCTWSGRAWRYTPAHRQPLDARGSEVHGGRWNPAGAFPALYLGTPRQTVLDDLAAALRALDLPARAAADFLLHDIRITDVHLLDLRAPAARRAFGLLDEDLVAEQRTTCQQVGRTARDDGLDGVVAPAATGSGLVLAVFPDRAPAHALSVERTQPLRLE